ncbi:MAG TPA: SDR family oxidoreductase [Blastococcus sp.]|nr:SDR family oxidoreductase [Blastococcus sp.]
MDLHLSGKRFVVVGGSKGMGRASAENLAAEGADLVLIARGAEALEQARDELAGAHGVDVGTVVATDAEGRDGVGDAVTRAVAEFGPLQGLAVLAGPMDGDRGELHELSDEDWDYFYERQVMLAVRACRAILPHLVENGGGTLVTTSAYSIRAQKPTLVHYTAMKSAIASLTKNIAKTYGDRGVRANCICPGMVDTPLLSVDREALVARYGGTETEALNRYAIEEWDMKVALQRAGQPHEVGELVAFLLSDRAAYLTGATINIDGGTDF